MDVSQTAAAERRMEFLRQMLYTDGVDAADVLVASELAAASGKKPKKRKKQVREGRCVLWKRMSVLPLSVC